MGNLSIFCNPQCESIRESCKGTSYKYLLQSTLHQMDCRREICRVQRNFLQHTIFIAEGGFEEGTLRRVRRRSIFAVGLLRKTIKLKNLKPVLRKGLG